MIYKKKTPYLLLIPIAGCPVADAKTLEEKITTPLLVGTPEAIILAGVVFSDSVGKETLPNKLNISIRFPGESRNQTSSDSDGADGSQNSGVRPKTWNTGYVFPLYQVAGPRNREDTFGGSPGYYNEGFLGIQNGIFARLLKYQADKKNLILPEFNITLKRFPYPKFIDDKLLPALESFVPVIIMLSFLYTAVSTVRTVTTEKEKQLKVCFAAKNNLMPKTNEFNYLIIILGSYEDDGFTKLASLDSLVCSKFNYVLRICCTYCNST